MPRTIAIGDIHGCAIALAKLIEAVAPQPDDTVVPLGDYVDRGIDSRGVIDQLISLAGRCRVVPILGNHEEMLLGGQFDRDGAKVEFETQAAASRIRRSSRPCYRSRSRLPLNRIADSGARFPVR